MRLNSKKKLLCFITCLLSTFSGMLFAQTTTGDIVGTVLDASGAAVPLANVSVADVSRGTVRTVVANDSGDFSFEQLQPGTYSLHVEMKGFETAVVDGIILSAGQRFRVSPTLNVGSVSEQVEVSAQAAALQTDTSTVQALVPQREVEDVPLSGRNYMSLVQVTPGVTAGAANSISSGNRPDDRRQSSTVSANGQSDLQNDFMVDSQDNNERHHGLQGIRPSVDAIAEIEVQTNSYRADVGRTSGAVINIITKAGTNDFHGTAFEYFGNDIFNARDFFARGNTPEYRQNQFGGSVGGPIAKNKTFFFAAVENLRFINGQTFVNSVPTAYEHNHPGDFTDIGGPLIPVASLNPIGLKYFSLYPLPNIGPPTQTANNFGSSPTQTQFITTVDGRLDHHFSDKDAIFAHYSYNPANTFVPPALPVSNGVQAGGGSFAGPSRTVAQGIALDYEHIFTPHVLLDLKAGYTRINITTQTVNQGSNAAAAFGLVGADLSSDPAATGLTPVSVTGYSALGDATYLPIFNTNNTFQYSGSVSYARGAHSLRMGGAFIRRQINFLQTSAPTGSYSFNTASGPYTNALANLLVGAAASVTRQNLLYKQGVRASEFSGYLQDDWRVSRVLTLNLGVRYEVFPPLVQAHNNYANFDPATVTVVVAGQTTSRALGVKTDYGNVSPRIGFAATPLQHTVIRGGFGISYFPQDNEAEADNLNPPFSYNYNATRVNLSTPLPIPVAPNLATLASNSRITSLYYKPSNFTTGYMLQSNLQVEQSFGKNLVTVGYVMNLGRRLSYSSDFDRPIPTGPVPPGTPAPPTKYFAQLPFVTSISEFSNIGRSNYNALQASFERRSEALTYSVNYTWAHSLSDAGDDGTGVYGLVVNNPNYDYGNSGLDVRHRIAGTVTYSLPFGKNLTGLAGVAGKGWHVNGLAFWQTGLPFTVTESVAPGGRYGINLPLVTSDRPNINIAAATSSDNRTLSHWFNPTAFSAPTLGTPGDEPNNVLRAPSDRRIDLSLFKEFNVAEKARLQFRAECFNVTNTPNFAAPASNITAYDALGNSTAAGGFGSISSTLATERPRQFQFALKIFF